MFRKIGLFVAALALLALVPQAQAAKGDWKLSVLGGMTVPMGDFSQKLLSGGLGAKTGFGTGASVDYMVIDQLAVGVDGFYAKNGLNSDERDLFRLIDPTFDFNYSQVGGRAHLKYWFPISDSPMEVYLVGGGGFSHFKVEAEASGVSASATENKFSGYGGLGLGYKASDAVTVGVQSDFNFVPLTGVTASSFGIQAGLTFTISPAK